MKVIITVALVWISIKATLCQTTDTLIYAQGNIVNGATKEAVVAKVSYRSEPYGNIMGSLSGNSYSIPLFDGQRYSITVEAPGFAPATLLLDPVNAVDRKVIQHVELGLPAPVEKKVETNYSVGKSLTLQNLIFSSGTATITKESYPELDELAKMLRTNSNMIILLEGHTDIVGDPKKNMKLSQDRVDEVTKYLVSKGARKPQIQTKAFGGTMPISREKTEAAAKLNRRVVLKILRN